MRSDFQTRILSSLAVLGGCLLGVCPSNFNHGGHGGKILWAFRVEPPRPPRPPAFAEATAGHRSLARRWLWWGPHDSTIPAGAGGAQEIGSARTALAIVDDPRTRRPILDVGADDFIVQEGSESREVLSVRMADYPVVVMIDVSGPAEDFPLIQSAAKHFVERLGRERAVAVGAFGGPPTILAGFDAERADVLNKLDEIAAAPSSDGSVLEAGVLAAQTAAATGSLFSSILILSTGASDQRPKSDSAAEGHDLVAPIVDSGAILYIVANRPGQPAAGTKQAGDSPALRALAGQTRGQFITIYTPASYQAAVDQIAVRMASELMIEYLVPRQSTATDVRIGVRIPGARVRGFGVAPR